MSRRAAAHPVTSKVSLRAVLELQPRAASPAGLLAAVEPLEDHAFELVRACDPYDRF
jgi:hypothetical protein